MTTPGSVSSAQGERGAQEILGSVVGGSFDRLCELISVSSEEIGPWWPDADIRREELRSEAASATDLASALLEQFLQPLSASLDLTTQEHWSSRQVMKPRLQCADHDVVYGDGEFSLGGIWTASTGGSGPSAARLAAWDLDETARRWAIRVTGSPRVLEIRSLDDWVDLVTSHPRAGRPTAPDWPAVSGRFDVVHLTWIGFLLAHDNLEAAERRNVLPLRFWGSERSLWLNDCLELL